MSASFGFIASFDAVDGSSAGIAMCQFAPSIQTPRCPLLADSVAKVAAVSGDDLCGARGIEVEGGIWPCSALSRRFHRLCTDTFVRWTHCL